MYIAILVYVCLVFAEGCQIVLNGPHCSCSLDKPDGWFEVTCRVDNSAEVLTLSNSHYGSYMHSINLELNNMTVLPQSILNFWNVTELMIGGDDITSIDDEAFVGIARLEELFMWYFPKLERFPDALSRLNNLGLLDIIRSRINSVNVSLLNTNLHRISLRKNHISTIIPGILPATLKSLEMAFNQLTSLNGSLRGNVTNLEELDISDNKIFNLSGEFDETPKLKTLVANDNLIQTIDNGIFEKTPDLQSLYLSGNLITSIVNGLRGLFRLKVLNLERNGLSHLHETALVDLTSLRKLVLRNNDLTHLEKGVFACLSSLEYLNIEDNILTELNFMISLETLRGQAADSSQILPFANCNARNSSRILNIDIYGNNFTCDSSYNTNVNQLRQRDIVILGSDC